jgi:hypothetical protein
MHPPNEYFKIKINTSDTVIMKEQLNSIYGINLADSVAELEFLRIEFDETPMD